MNSAGAYDKCNSRFGTPPNWGPERVVRRLLGASPPTTLSEARLRLDRFAPLETRLYIRRVTDRLALYGTEGMLLGAAGWRPPLLVE